MEEENIESELYEHNRIIADKNQSLIRIDKFLTDRLPNASRNRIQNGIKNGAVLVNNREIKCNYRIHPHDIVTVVLPHPPILNRVEPEDIALDIVFEDDDLLIINKPVNMVVHPGYNNWNRTVVNGLVFHFNNLPNKSKETNRPGLVHRIDKNTSGLLVVAKTEDAMTHLAKQFFYHTIERKYLCLVWNKFDNSEGTIDAPLSKSPSDRRVVVCANDAGAKRAITHYRVIKNFSHTALVECRLETGRTHQIRCHMQSIGHPIFGDSVYGGDIIPQNASGSKFKKFVENCLEIMPHQALHAQILGFTHPSNGKNIKFEALPPDNFSLLIERWENYSKSHST